MREIIQTAQFKKDFKKIAASGRYHKKDLLKVVELLLNNEALPSRVRDHALINDWKDYRECHIKPDWLLIYKKTEDHLILVRTGSHSDLF